MSTLLAKNAEVLVTMDGQRRELKNAGIYVEEGFVKQIGLNGELPATALSCRASSILTIT